MGIMEKTLQVLNEMERSGVIRRYAIGDAVGAIFYMEPILTYDLDVFVVLPGIEREIVTLDPIYVFLRARGYTEERECINVEGVPVQFLPAFNPLIEESLTEAVETVFEQTRTRVLRPEHLVAIMLHTGRRKDMERLASFVEEVHMDKAYLDAVLERHGLMHKWQRWRGER
jgi:hypothetical protein